MRRLAIISLVTVFAGLLLFAGSWDNPFVLDDIAKIQENVDLRSPKFNFANLIRPYSEYKVHNRTDPSRPLTFALYWAAWQLGNGDVRPFHILNTLVHIFTSLLVGLLFVRLIARQKNIPLSNPWPEILGLSASLIYLTLPLNVGTVIYAYGLSDLLSALFGVGILLFVASEKTLSTLKLSGIAVLFLLALASKQSSIVIPALALILNPRQRRAHWALWGLALLYFVARFAYFGRIGDLEAEETFAAFDYFLMQGLVIIKYLTLAMWPEGLSIDHAIQLKDHSLPVKILSHLVILSVTVFMSWKLWRDRNNPSRFHLAAFGWIIFWLSVLPTSSFFPTTDLMVERRTYFGMAGLTLIFVADVAYLATRSIRWAAPVAAALLVLTVISQGYASLAHMRIFADEEKLWTYQLELYSEDTRARLNLGAYYLKQKNFTKAHQVFADMVAMNPQNDLAWMNLGYVYQNNENPYADLNKAQDAYLQVLQLRPNEAKAMSNLGYLHLTRGHLNEAQGFFERALRINPNFPPLHFGLGLVEFQRGQKEKAKRHFESTLGLDPKHEAAIQALQQLSR